MCVCVSLSLLLKENTPTHSLTSKHTIMNRNKSYEDDDDNPLDRNKTKWSDLKRNPTHMLSVPNTHMSGVSQVCNNDSSIPPTPGDVGGRGTDNGNKASERKPWHKYQGRKASRRGRYRAKVHVLSVPEALALLRRMQRGNGRRAMRAARTVAALFRDPGLVISPADGQRLVASGPSLRAWRRVAREIAAQRAARRRERVRARAG